MDDEMRRRLDVVEDRLTALSVAVEQLVQAIHAPKAGRRFAREQLRELAEGSHEEPSLQQRPSHRGRAHLSLVGEVTAGEAGTAGERTITH